MCLRTYIYLLAGMVSRYFWYPAFKINCLADTTDTRWYR